MNSNSRAGMLRLLILFVMLFVFLVVVYGWRNGESGEVTMGLIVNQGKVFVDDIRELVRHQFGLAWVVTLLIYTLVCSIPFPFVSAVTILIGYLFGLTHGLLITSLGSAIGASILFLLARFFLVGRTGATIIESLINRFPSVATLTKSQNIWMATSVRFIPGLPFFIPSLIFSATKLSVTKFFLATQLGLFVTLAVYVNAGRLLAEIDSAARLFSPSLIASMLIVALLPLMYRLIGLLPIK